jgi:4-carboxymuconolactone decarboxylase
MLVGSGQEDVLEIQIPAALSRGDVDAEAWREIVILVAHYAGWARGARLNNKVEAAIAAHEAGRSTDGD